MQLGVRAKFFIVTVLIVVAVDFAAGVYLQVKLKADHEARIEDELSRHARASREFLGPLDEPWAPELIDPWADRLGAAMDTRVTIIDAEGLVLGDSNLEVRELAGLENHADRPEVRSAQPDRCGLSTRYSETLNTEMLYCAVVLEGERGYVRVATPLRDLDETFQRLRLVLVFAGLLAVALAIGAGSVASRLMYGRLRALMEAAQAVAEGDQSREIPVTSSDEFGGLAGSLSRVSKELERTVKELTSERDLFEAVLQSMEEAVLAVDADRCVVAVNRSARDLLSINGKVQGRLLLEVVRIPQLSDAVDTALRGESRSIDVNLETRSGLHHLLVRATPRGEGSGAVLVIHDVTEVRRLETVRRDFVANVSHELRTPVSIIQANTETLLAGALDEPAQARRFLDAVRRNAERLGQLISDLLDISRIEAGKYAIEMRPLSVASVARSVNKAVAEACRRRGVVLEVDIEPELQIRADAGALEQVLINLVENAVKYGPEGGLVELAAREDGAAVRIEVRDEGPGIAPDHRKRVFERFYRVDPGRSRHMGGTGLGLAIVKNLTDVMGGDVGVTPREPTGSIFWLSLGRATEDDNSTHQASGGNGQSSGGSEEINIVQKAAQG